MADALAPCCYETSGIVSCVEFGPCQHCAALLAVGTGNIVAVIKCSLNESLLQSVHNLAEALQCEDVLEVPMSSRVRRLAWSPSSRLTAEETAIQIATACGNNKITVISSDVMGMSIQLIEGHNSYINAISFHPTDHTLLVSAGDDHLVKLWKVGSGEELWCIQLSSPVVSTCFNPQEPLQLMVAEKKGRVHVYNLDAHLPVITVTCPEFPLLQADWSETNKLRIGAVAGSNWYMWDISKSSLPIESCSAHIAMATGFKWCRTSDSAFITTSVSGEVKVHHCGHLKVPLSSVVPVANGAAWHAKLPVVAVASAKILFWGVEP